MNVINEEKEVVNLIYENLILDCRNGGERYNHKKITKELLIYW